MKVDSIWNRLYGPSSRGTPATSARALGLEALEGRRLLSADLPFGESAGGPVFGGPGEFEVAASARSNTISDARGDFLPTYTGPHDPGLDVVEHQTTLAGDRVIFFGKMAGPVAPTQDIGGLYIIGVDRGRGAPRFRSGTPLIRPKVTSDLIVRINPQGTGPVNNQVAGLVTPLDPADIKIHGNSFTASVPLSVLTPAATRPPEEWTYNLWPRNGLVPGRNVNVSDLAPDDGNSPVQVLSRNGSVGFGQFGPAQVAAPEGVGAAGNVVDRVLGLDDGSLLA
jgi:hypothetical protein